VDIFTDIGLIIIVATIGGFIAKFFKQPLIPAYIVTGIIIGPVLGLIRDMHVVDVLSEIGIAFLLFIVGIELDLERLKDVGSVASIGALMQMALSFAAGFACMMILGFSSMVAFYGGVVLTFSSTMVVIKLLADKSQLDTLHGRIVIGILLMQDVVAVLMLSIMTNLDEFSTMGLMLSLLQGVLMFGIAFLMSKFVFPRMFKFAAKSQELFFLLSLSVCFVFSLVFAKIGFSIAIGAFIAGIMLGNLPYNVEIISKVKSLRDFFSTLFFVSIGIKLTFGTLVQYSGVFSILLLLSVVLSPFLTFLITMFFGYGRKVAFLTAISLAQVSEFALIAASQGIKLGHIDQSFLSLIIMLTLTSMTSTAYAIKYQDKIYKYLLPVLKFFDKISHKKHHYGHKSTEPLHDTILVGYDRIGFNIYNSLLDMGRDILIVDYNPDIIKRLMYKQIKCIYGDIGDEEILEKLHLSRVKTLISTIPNVHDNTLLIHMIRKHNKECHIIVTAYHVQEAMTLYQVGADYVIMPHFLGGKHAGILLQSLSSDIDTLVTTRLNHINELKQHNSMFNKNQRKHISNS